MPYSLPPPAGQSLLSKIVMRVIMALVGLLGASALQAGIQLLRLGDANSVGAVVAILMGSALVALAAGYFYLSMVRGPREAARRERTRLTYPGQPWMQRSDWAARRVTHTSGGVAIFLWIWVLGWWGAIGFIGSVNNDKIRAALSQSAWNYALIGVFVGAGLIGLVLALKFTLDWWRYGTTTLHLDTLPAYVGERFRGTLEARLRPVPTLPLQLELVCEEIEWVTTGHGKDRSTKSVVRPQGKSTASLDPRRFAPGAAGLRGHIELAVPSGLPESRLDERGNGIRWVVRVSTAAGDQPFACEFEVPVFGRPH